MASSDRIDELKRKFDENPRRYFAPLANEFRKGGDFDQAILICQEFLPQQPGHMSGHIVYGQALYESGRLDEARGVFETALSLDPENLIALRHLGDIASRQADAPAARRWYERVLEADPRNDEIHALIGALGASTGFAAEPGSQTRASSEPRAPEPVQAAEGPPAMEARPLAAHADTPELLDLDVTLPNTGHAVPVAADARADDSTVSEFSRTILPGIEPTPETADLMPAVEGRTDGFEAGEFTAPQAPVEQTPGLQSSYEVETGVHPVFFAPLAGLDRPETTVEPTPALETTSAFPELDEPLPEDRGEVVPPHGDPIAESAPSASPAVRDEALLDFDMPLVDEPARHAAPSPVSHEAEAPRLESEPVDSQPVDASPVSAASPPTIPTELPPEVIAAEAALIDAGASIVQPEPSGVESESRESESLESESLESESVGGELSFLDVGEAASVESGVSVSESSQAGLEPIEERVTDEEPSPDAGLAEPRPFVTETMAELYLKQGFRQEALSVYEQLSGARPDDERLREKVGSLRAELAAPVKPSGPPVREFFARFAARRPGERAAAAAPPAFDDFGPSDAASGTPAEDAMTDASSDDFGRDSAVHAAPSPATAAQPRTGGSIDALFGNQSVDAPEDSAASALAQAFGTGGEPAQISGNPARQASGELTLDSVFHDGGSRAPRTSQGFSFDQFFSQNVDGERTSGGDAIGESPVSGEPAERTEDDIEQFNSWLQGLKQR